MKKIAPLLAIVAILLLGYSIIFRSSQSHKLVYVDVNKLLKEYERTKVVRANFEKKATVLKSNVDSLIVSWQKELKS